MGGHLDDEIDRYLRTGDYEPSFTGWPGGTVVECERNGRAALKAALVAEVEKRSAGRATLTVIPDEEIPAFARAKVAPMVCGFFPRREQEPVLKLLERSIVFLTPTSILSVLPEERWLHTAWSLANLYLGSIGADLLSPDAPAIVGMSEETTSYVSSEYFAQRNRFADFVVHEAAHVFHNCKRRTAGLPETRTREWLLDIEFRKRETFAYACEAYSRILELGRRLADRQRLLEELEGEGLPGDETVRPDEILQVLREAVAARNGWKRILVQCAPRPRGASERQPAVLGPSSEPEAPEDDGTLHDPR